MAATVVTPNRATIINDAFDGYRRELDEYNDRRERLIKASRDITVASKRLIFHLHRFPASAFAGRASHDDDAADRVIKEAIKKRSEIVSMIKSVAAHESLESEAETSKTGSRAERFDRAYGPGLEEFIEAVSLLHFLQTGAIISRSEVQALFQEESTGRTLLPITTQRYLLGLSDLSGELMRFATNALGAGDPGNTVQIVLNVLRELTAAMDPFVPLIRDFRKKQSVTRQSMQKIENLSYAIKVRSAEYGSDPAALQEMVRRALAGGGGGSGSGGEGGRSYDAGGGEDD